MPIGQFQELFGGDGRRLVANASEFSAGDPDHAEVVAEELHHGLRVGAHPRHHVGRPLTDEQVGSGQTRRPPSTMNGSAPWASILTARGRWCA